GVRGHQWVEFELRVWVRREFVFEFCLTCPITPIGLADPGDAIRRDLLLAFETDPRAFGKSEDVFCLDVIKSILRPRRIGIAQDDQTASDSDAHARSSQTSQ